MNEFPSLKEITIEIIGQCFQNCVHCSSLAFRSSQQSLTKDEITRVAEDFIQLGGETIEISGGEPFLHKYLFDLIDFFKKVDLKVVIYTCGKISENNDFENAMNEILEKLSDKEIDKIMFNLQGAKAETHNSITRTKNSFFQSTKFIKKLVDDKHYVGIHYVPMTPNFEELEDLIDYAVELGVKEIGFLRFVPQGRGEKYKDWLMLSKEESARLIELLAQSKKRTDIDIGIGSHLDFTFLLDGEPPKDCTAGKTKCLVGSNGDIVPCAVFKGRKEYVAGNIRKTSLIKTWKESKIFHQFRTFDPNSLKGACSTCQYLLMCKGRCPAQRIYDSGDFYQGPDSYCPKDFFHFPSGKN